GPFGDGGGTDGLNEEASLAESGRGLEGSPVGAEDQREDGAAFGRERETLAELADAVVEQGSPEVALGGSGQLKGGGRRRRHRRRRCGGEDEGAGAVDEDDPQIGGPGDEAA